MRFYQDYISSTFSDGRPLRKTIDELTSGKTTPDEIETLNAIRTTEGQIFCMTNRRFACFNIVFGPDKIVGVNIHDGIDRSTILPQGNGTTVVVGGGLEVDGKLRFTVTIPFVRRAPRPVAAEDPR